MELEKIKAIIAEVLNIDADSITEDTTFVDDLGADSLCLLYTSSVIRFHGALRQYCLLYIIL